MFEDIANPLERAIPLFLKTNFVSCALTCCIGNTTTAAASIATAAKAATITNVELLFNVLSTVGFFGII